MPDEVTLLYEDENFLAVNKPAGLVVHADGRTKEPTLVDWLLKKYPKIKKVGEPWTTPEGETVWRPGIVHRLDRDTSGVLVVAKTQEAFESLKKQFQERTIQKTYRAFVHGELPDDDGVIERKIGRSANDFRKWSAEYGARGELRDALTRYHVLARGGGVTFVEVSPKTGRTHQIRVHFKAVGHPLVGDALYAPKSPKILGFSRTALHAFALEVSGLSGKRLRFEAPLPKDFKKAIREMKKVA